MIREVAVTPNQSEISIVNSDDELVVVDVAVVILPKMQMINGAVDNAHTYELTKGTELFNNGKAYMKQGIHIIDFKKYLVVIDIDIRF